MQPTLIYITASGREEAILLARELLGKKLVACANVIDNVNSYYWWDGSIENNKEAVIIVKTMSTHVERVIDVVKKEHSYECPAIISVPITGGNPEYIEWIGKQISSENL